MDAWTLKVRAAQRRLNLKARAVEYKGGCCSLCGYDRCLQALAFHHVDPAQKDFEISTKMRWDVLKPELDKTLLVCHNCHSEVHSGLHPAWVAEGLNNGSGGDYNEPEPLEE